MPEGDTVRRSATTLHQALTGRRVERAELRWPSAVGVDLTGRTVLGTSSYGKHLLTRFDDGRTLHTHLRMEGSWALARTGSPGARGRGPYIRAVLGNAVWTALGDRLGMLDVVATRDEHTLVGHLGPDLLDDAFPTEGLPETLRRMAARGATPIAEVLLDQTVVAGIGTIWTAEPLFLRRIWPWTPTDRLTDPAGLLLATRALMARSVASTGPWTVTGEGGRGMTSYVHGRRGRPCRRCGTPVERGTARKPPMERPIFYCPRCQSPSAESGSSDAAAPAGTAPVTAADIAAGIAAATSPDTAPDPAPDMRTRGGARGPPGGGGGGGGGGPPGGGGARLISRSVRARHARGTSRDRAR